MDPLETIGTGEITLRLVVAVVVGWLLGLNREIHGKSAGPRTHGLVALGAALAAMLTLQLRDGYYVPQMDALSRVVQGILTGIGFLGAGVILRVNEGRTVGLTTAATIWTCAVMGVTCGLGHWSIVAISTGIVLIVLILGNPAERFLTGVFKKEPVKTVPKDD
jgi:putative Mg2+ transporter-C (MgtC) family protein